MDSRGASTQCLSRPLIPRKGCRHLEVLVRIVVKGLPNRDTVIPALKLSPPAHRNATFELCSSSRTQHPHVRGRGALGRQRAYLWSHGPGHPTGIGKLAGQMKWWVTNEPPTSAPLVVKPINGEELGRFSGSGKDPTLIRTIPTSSATLLIQLQKLCPTGKAPFGRDHGSPHGPSDATPDPVPPQGPRR